MTGDILYVIGGLVLLVGGGEVLVRGSVALARRLGMSPLMIGLTVVALGTSSPEIVVCVNAALNNSPGIAIGNVVGSDIANILLILAIGALIRPVPCQMGTLRRDGLMLTVSSAVVAVVALFGLIQWWQGILMLVALVGYLMFCYGDETLRVRKAEGKKTDDDTVPGSLPLWLSLLLVVIGLAALIGGAELLVDGAVSIATALGVSEAVIGVTLVAVGTSLPELAIVAVAAWRGQSDLVFGNVIGSNIFNNFGILGITTLFADIRVDVSAVAFDLAVMVVAAIMLIPMAATGRRLNRVEGGILIALYAGFTVLNFTGKPVLL